jgi:hypothetical protein
MDKYQIAEENNRKLLQHILAMDLSHIGEQLTPHPEENTPLPSGRAKKERQKRTAELDELLNDYTKANTIFMSPYVRGANNTGHYMEDMPRSNPYVLPGSPDGIPPPHVPKRNELPNPPERSMKDGFVEWTAEWARAMLIDALLSLIDKRELSSPVVSAFIAEVMTLVDVGNWNEFFAVVGGLAIYRNYDRITAENLYALLPDFGVSSWFGYDSNHSIRRRRRSTRQQRRRRTAHRRRD